MNLPNKDFKIEITPFTVDVVYVKRCNSSSKERLVFGTWSQEKLRMELSTTANKNPQQMQNTFIHEVFHALFDTTGLDGLENPNEEIICDRLAHGFQSFIKDNPKLFKTK